MENGKDKELPSGWVEIDLADSCHKISLSGIKVKEKEYKESMKQLEKSVAGYMVNIEQTNKKMLPELDKFTVNQSYNQNKGKEIINAYQKARLDLN